MPFYTYVLCFAVVSSACSRTPTPPVTEAPRAGSSETTRDSSSSDADGCFGVTNALPTKAFRSVVFLRSPTDGRYCTGVFVGDNTLLSAAHCIDGSANGGIGVMLGGELVMPAKALHQGAVGEDHDTAERDISVLIFPTAVAPAVTPVTTHAAKVGDLLTLVGYGDTVLNEATSNGNAGKFTGQNKVRGLIPNAVATWGESGRARPHAAAGKDSVSGNGDSGGPFFSGNVVAALVSQGGVIDATNVDTFRGEFSDADMNDIQTKLRQGYALGYDEAVDLASPTHQAFLRGAASQGAHIEFEIVAENADDADGIANVKGTTPAPEDDASDSLCSR
jgi:hypothetical protein